MKFNSFSSLILMLLTGSAVAMTNPDDKELSIQRNKVINQYITDLKNADYKDITQLFVKNGFVVSTSRGHINAKDFFYSFLPNIETADTELHQSFVSDRDSNRRAVRFHFNFKLKDGEIGNGEYVDEFIFSDYSAKIVAVYMFENLSADRFY